MATPCLVCKKEIAITWNAGIYTGDETSTVEFRGNDTYERGRYRIHDSCQKPEFSKKFLTMAMLEGKEEAHDPDVAARAKKRRGEV